MRGDNRQDAIFERRGRSVVFGEPAPKRGGDWQDLAAAGLLRGERERVGGQVHILPAQASDIPEPLSGVETEQNGPLPVGAGRCKQRFQLSHGKRAAGRGFSAFL